jgi:hypothetical protein
VQFCQTSEYSKERAENENTTNTRNANSNSISKQELESHTNFEPRERANSPPKVR